MENNHKILLVVGAGVLIVVLLLMRRSTGGSSPTVITTQNSDLTPEQSRIQLAGINAGMFSKLLDYASGQTTTQSAERLGTQRISASRDIALNQTGVASDIEKSRLSVQRELGLAQVDASKVIAQTAGANAALQAQQASSNYLAGLRAQQQMQNAQNRNNAIQSALSQLGNILKALNPASSKPSSGSSGSTGQSGNTSVSPRSIANYPRLPVRGTPWQGLFDALPSFDYNYTFPSDAQNFYPPDVNQNSPSWSDFNFADFNSFNPLLTPDTSQINIFPLDDVPPVDPSYIGNDYNPDEFDPGMDIF